MTETTEEGRWKTYVVMGQIPPLLGLSGQTRLGFAGAGVCGICLEAAENLRCPNKIGFLDIRGHTEVYDRVTADYDLSSFAKASSTLLGDGLSDLGVWNFNPTPCH